MADFDLGSPGSMQVKHGVFLDVAVDQARMVRDALAQQVTRLSRVNVQMLGPATIGVAEQSSEPQPDGSLHELLTVLRHIEQLANELQHEVDRLQ